MGYNNLSFCLIFIVVVFSPFDSSPSDIIRSDGEGTAACQQYDLEAEVMKPKTEEWALEI